jgi:hypothetical protein
VRFSDTLLSTSEMHITAISVDVRVQNCVTNT